MASKDDTRIEPTAGAPDPYDDEPEEDFEEDEAPRRRSGRVLPIVVASLAMIGFVVIVYYAYQQGIRAGSEANPPVIRAEDGPAKVRPASPGGMEVPNQNMKVYELGRPGAQSAAAGPERILPKPEEPMQRPAAGEPPPPQAAPTLPVSADAAPQSSGGVVTPPPPPLPGSGQAMPAPAPSMAETLTSLTPPAKPSDNLAVPPPPPPPPRSALVPGGRAPAQTAAVPPPAPAAAQPQRQPAASAPAAPSRAGPTVQAAQQQQAAATPALPAAPQAAPRSAPPVAPQAAPAAASGGSRVQLAAPNSQEGAEKLAKDSQAKFGDLLGGLSPQIETFTDNRGTFYRVQFGPLASKADAEKLCDALKARKQACIPK
jgi:hypothetical protein